MTNNPAGKPKGTVNKTSLAIREKIAAFLEANFEEVQKDFERKELFVKDKLKFYTGLLPFAAPKLQSSTLEVSFDSLLEEQLDAIIEELKKSVHNAQ